MSDAIWHVYLLLCRGNRIYTGVSPDPVRRLGQHLQGKGARYTRMNQPVRLLAVRPVGSKREALSLEARIKPLPHTAKRHIADQWSEQHSLDHFLQQLPALDQ
ncbi:GIY-YIG nuclease family protein [Algiphilus aromaticivorans]|uniref:GIY-YIG nuclease family protein n=1 Tax=Algiphilus aromaticivorans TaxID=382454 RepID=UPI000A03CE49